MRISTLVRSADRDALVVDADAAGGEFATTVELLDSLWERHGELAGVVRLHTHLSNGESVRTRWERFRGGWRATGSELREG